MRRKPAPRALAPLVSALALILGAGGCGEEDGSLALGLDMRLFALEGDEILQFVVLRDRDSAGRELACPSVTSNCVADQPGLRIVPLSGGGECAFRAPLDLDAAGSADGQPVSVRGIPPGSDYLLVVEVVRPAARGEERVGVGCLPVERIATGTNPPPSAPLEITSASGCRPTLDGC